jgi:HEAT repeat protein/ATP/ADP translocase
VIVSLLRIRPGEGRVVFRVLAMMFVVWSGFAIGGNAVEGLLFARFGPNALPYLFVGLGLTTAVVMLTMNALLARPRPQRLLLLVLPAMIGVILAMWALLLLEARWLYPVMWLAMMVLWTAIGVVIWGVAGTVHDTRQAKRLFPLYGSGLILGGVIGGVATAPLAAWLGAENLLLLWGLALGATFLLARSALRTGGAMVKARSRPLGPRGSLPARVAEGFRSVRGSPLISWMAVSIGLFAVVYFSLSLLFARAATSRFPDADRLAGFLGLFMGVTSGVALLVSVFLANRLFARVGVTTAILALPVIYVAGFTVIAVWTNFTSLLVFRTFQMVWINGVWAGGWQALYNVVPPERRDATRAFVDGVALQAGVAFAGVMLILAQRVLPARAVAIMGLVVAGLALLSARNLRRAYPGAVVDALRAGNPDVFLTEEEPFGGVRRDAAAMAIVAGGASDPDPAVRRVSMEILAEVADPDSAEAFLLGLDDEDPVVRAAALRGTGRLGEQAPLEQVRGVLRDRDAAVRLAAVEAFVRIGGASRSPAPLRPLLGDPDPRVRAAAAGALLGSEEPTAPGAGEALSILEAMTRSDQPDWRAEAVGILGAVEAGLQSAAAALGDPDPVVRRSAASALGGSSGADAPRVLVRALEDPSAEVRAVAVEGLVRAGDRARGPLMDALSHPELEAAAMLTLGRLDGVDPVLLRSYALREVERAVRYATLLRALSAGQDARIDLLAHAVRHRTIEHAEQALHTAGRFSDPTAIRLATENLSSRDPGQRANALETLEAVGDPDMVRPLLRALEAVGSPSERQGSSLEEALADALGDPDPWVRACAGFAAAARPELRRAVEGMARSDPDSMVRDVAAGALEGDRAVETLPSLSIMERVVFLRRVPLFVDLAPSDLKQVAEIASEHVYPDGEAVAEQGEPGEEMFVLVSGEIRVMVRRDGGAPVEVARRRVGESVGEMAVVSRAPRMASLVAQGEVRTLAIDRRRFERILRERPEASLAVMGVLCTRLRESHGGLPPEAHA